MGYSRRQKLLVFFTLLLVHVEAKPAENPNELLGVDFAGMHAGISSNILADDGPIAEMGNALEKEANELLGGFDKMKHKVDAELKSEASGKAAAPSGDNHLVGVNVLGFKAGLDTNLFDKDGPIAEAENDLDKLLKQGSNFVKKVEDSGSELLDGLFGAPTGSESTNFKLSLSGGAGGSGSSSMGAEGAAAAGAEGSAATGGAGSLSGEADLSIPMGITWKMEENNAEGRSADRPSYLSKSHNNGLGGKMREEYTMALNGGSGGSGTSGGGMSTGGSFSLNGGLDFESLEGEAAAKSKAAAEEKNSCRL